MPTTALIFSGVSAGLLYKKDLDGLLDEDGVNDRSFRLAHNSGQLKVDSYALNGALTGSAIGAILGRAAVRSVVASGLTGVAVGVATYAAETFVVPKLRESGFSGTVE